ncbi:MAG: tryptophan-rich sensory protein [Gammaproteobacteria bacterium]|nr:tryptophan-rich sensory protein [Gammaproteobacteria bacterium]
MTERSRIFPLANAIALAGTVFVNGLASSLPLNGQTTGQISNRFDVYFVPASYVFSIWGLIYLSLIAFVFYQWLPRQRNNPLIERIGWLFVASCAANGLWIFMWHYELFELSLVVMLAMLVILSMIYLRLDIGRKPPSRNDWLFIRFPFSLYLGWISVATIANATSLLDHIEWGQWGLSAETWMQIMLAVVAGLSLVIAWLRRDLVYLLVIVWALAGIAVKHEAVAVVATSTWIATGFVGVLVVLLALGWRRHAYQ